MVVCGGYRRIVAPLVLTVLVSATGEITVPGFHCAACSLLSFIGVVVALQAYQQG